MAKDSPSMSPVKLGLMVAWSAFWTGIPFKLVIALLFLAMGVHPWDMPGLAFLLLLSIPIDIWALSLTARTVFLDRLRIKAPDSIGLTLWWQAAAMSAIYIPAAYLVGSQVIAVAKSMASSIMGWFQGLPIAERISLELVLWGSVATVTVLMLALGWLFLFGGIVRKQLLAGTPVEVPYPALVRQWDAMRVPADQPLLFTAFTAAGVVFVLLFWAFMPATTPHPDEQYASKEKEKKVSMPLRPVDALQKTEKVIAQAESAIQALEAKAEADGKEKDKGKNKESAKEPTAKAEPVKAVR